MNDVPTSNANAMSTLQHDVQDMLPDSVEETFIDDERSGLAVLLQEKSYSLSSAKIDAFHVGTDSVSPPSRPLLETSPPMNYVSRHASPPHGLSLFNRNAANAHSNLSSRRGLVEDEGNAVIVSGREMRRIMREAARERREHRQNMKNGSKGVKHAEHVQNKMVKEKNVIQAKESTQHVSSDDPSSGHGSTHRRDVYWWYGDITLSIWSAAIIGMVLVGAGFGAGTLLRTGRCHCSAAA